MDSNKNENKLLAGILALAAFLLWTILIQTVDIAPIGPQASEVGFAALNGWFHALTGVHMSLYTATDYLELLAIGVCAFFGVFGLIQLVKRKSLRKVDHDILLLGAYYIVVILVFLLFEKLNINFRPILIDGKLEASYPSSTTLLVASVMPTLVFQANRRVKNLTLRRAADILAIAFTAFIVIARTVSGVHWLSDIIGSLLFSAGLFLVYCALAGKLEKA